MPSIDLNSLYSQVKSNCNISDAKFWGNYSICGLLMRLRELYRKEHGIMPWDAIMQPDILAWIADRENLWNEIAEHDFLNISISGLTFGPFDTQKINSLLEDSGIIYGAGLGINMKPSFFVGELLAKKVVDGLHVFVTGNEFARDLSAYPAMLQETTIFVRRDALAILLWDKFEEMKLRKNAGPLAYAFTRYDITAEDSLSEDLYRKIRKVSEKETETFLYHELGEAFEGERLGEGWRQMLSEIENRRVEFFLRGIKDVLSDTSEKGMLQHIIKNDKKGSLGFYLALLGGSRKIVFPDIIKAFEEFAKNGDWGLIEGTRKNGYLKAQDLASRVLHIYHQETDKASFENIIEKEFLTVSDHDKAGDLPDG